MKKLFKNGHDDRGTLHRRQRHTDDNTVTRFDKGDNITNAISFDLEHWHSATLVRNYVEDAEAHLNKSVSIVLEILDTYDVTATFFTVGEVAAEYPALISRISEAGHEIGSHGHTHTPVSNLTPDEFRHELRDSTDAIRACTGEEPLGFRAPNFSITRETQWAPAILAEQGYQYDSSVFPVKTPMYGVRGAPIAPYYLHPDQPFTSFGKETSGELVEFPLAVFHPLVRVPVAGGFYARLLPHALLERGIRNLNKHGIPATLYFHPWEFNTNIDPPEMPPHLRFITFHGQSTLVNTLRKLFEAFEFASHESILAAEWQ